MKIARKQKNARATPGSRAIAHENWCVLVRLLSRARFRQCAYTRILPVGPNRTATLRERTFVTKLFNLPPRNGADYQKRLDAFYYFIGYERIGRIVR